MSRKTKNYRFWKKLKFLINLWRDYCVWFETQGLVHRTPATSCRLLLFSTWMPSLGADFFPSRHAIYFTVTVSDTDFHPWGDALGRSDRGPPFERLSYGLRPWLGPAAAGASRGQDAGRPRANRRGTKRTGSAHISSTLSLLFTHFYTFRGKTDETPARPAIKGGRWSAGRQGDTSTARGREKKRQLAASSDTSSRTESDDKPPPTWSTLRCAPQGSDDCCRTRTVHYRVL